MTTAMSLNIYVISEKRQKRRELNSGASLDTPVQTTGSLRQSDALKNGRMASIPVADLAGWYYLY
jgi:hypothetical protein